MNVKNFISKQAIKVIGPIAVCGAAYAGYYIGKKQTKHKVEEAYKAGANAATDACNSQLSRVYAASYTNLHCYAIGMSVYNEHRDCPEPSILRNFRKSLKSSDNKIVRDLYQKIRHQYRTISERIDEYCQFLNDLEYTDRHRSLTKVNQFMETLSEELDICVNSDWTATYNHFMSL